MSGVGKDAEIVGHDISDQDLSGLDMSEDTEDVEAPEEADTQDETPDGEDESGDTEDAEEAEESEDADEPEESDDEPEPEPVKGRDKALQKLQQQQTADRQHVEKQFTDLGDKLAKLTDAIESKGGNATEKQQEQVQDVKDEAAELIASLGDDNDEILDVGQAKRMFEAFLGNAKQPDVKSAVKEALAEQASQQAENKRQQDERFREQEREFDSSNKAIAGRFNEVLDQASEDLRAEHGDVSGAEFDVLYKRVFFPQAVKKALEGASSESKPTPRRKLGTKPPKSAKGASTKPASASAAVKGSGIIAHEVGLDVIPDFTDDDGD